MGMDMDYGDEYYDEEMEVVVDDEGNEIYYVDG